MDLAMSLIWLFPKRSRDYALRRYRCLVVLDNVESILQKGQVAGQYQEGYEEYGQLLQLIGEGKHQSCLLLTSREKPKEVASLEGNTLPVRALQLLGMGQPAGQEILKEKGLLGSSDAWGTLIQLYSGNPLALKLVSETIREVFEGNVTSFLQKEELVFGGIYELLDQQFHCLSELEWDVSTGLCLNVLRGHAHWVHSVAFSPDGKILATGSNDGTIKVWDVKTDKCLQTLRNTRPYERMNITHAEDLTVSQKAMFKDFGAIEDDKASNMLFS
jgi:WD40 repeat protein